MTQAIFCYVCGNFTTVKQRKAITNKLKHAYRQYFGVQLGDQDKSWAPHISCSSCYITLTQWLNGKNKKMAFRVPMVWREQRDHFTDCYFCMTKISGFSKKSKSKVKYPNCISAIKPVPHSDEHPVPEPPSQPSELDSKSEASTDGENSSASELQDSTPVKTSQEPHFLTQGDLQDLARDLKLSKEKSEILASRLKQWNLLQKGVNITTFRKRHYDLAVFFHSEEDICYCTDIYGLMNSLDHQYESSDWRLFIDSNKTSLKAVLLRNGNQKPSVPVAYSKKTKETFKRSYESMKHLLACIRYHDHKWHICGDLKVVGLLLGLQMGYTRYMCFLCLWNSRADEQHYETIEWPSREIFHPGSFNVQHLPLVDAKKVFLPLLHIKLGLIKNFVKAMNKEGEGFKHICETFCYKSKAKLEQGIFVGPEIRKLLKDDVFKMKLTSIELHAWEAFASVATNFLGNHKAPNYEKCVTKMLEAYKEMGARMSLKMHFLHSHLDFFPENNGDVSDEHGERFHQDIKILEERYQGKASPAMMADFCWSIQRDTDESHRRKRRCPQHF